jgi:hypothetical protein
MRSAISAALAPSAVYQSLQRSWLRFWQEPIASERLALFRICLGLTMLADQALQFAPQFGYLFGPKGISPKGYSQTELSRSWELFGLLPAQWLATNRLSVMVGLFVTWVLVTLWFTLGYKTRWASVALWITSGLMLGRHPALRNAGDNVLMNALFVMMFAPSGEALSLDAYRGRNPDGTNKFTGEFQNPWAVRIFQLLLCSLYTGSAVHKLHGGLHGTWLSGTTLHYVFNDFGLTRWPFAKFPVPEWILTLGTYASLFWEAFFIPLVWFKPTRRWALWFGIAFHLMIYLVVEVGWFSFYSIACYAVWVPEGWIQTRVNSWFGRWLARPTQIE